MSHKTSRKLELLTALALPLLFGASGCHSFKYFDISYSYDQAIDDSVIHSITKCRIIVSGADTDNYILRGCPNTVLPDPHTGGQFEFASFADSGMLTFEFKGFQGAGADNPDCLALDGSVSVAVTSAMTIPSALSVKGTGKNCFNVTPPTDGGP
jgi:hypothetical protein